LRARIFEPLCKAYQHSIFIQLHLVISFLIRDLAQLSFGFNSDSNAKEFLEFAFDK
jgi:hypothetical protein